MEVESLKTLPTVKNSYIKGDSGVGGLVGFAIGTVTIEGCSNSGIVREERGFITDLVGSSRGASTIKNTYYYDRNSNGYKKYGEDSRTYTADDVVRLLNKYIETQSLEKWLRWVKVNKIFTGESVARDYPELVLS